MSTVFYLHKAIKRFWSKVNKKGPYSKKCRSCCWEWTAGKNNDGYVQFWVNGENCRGSRFIWTVTYGEIPVGFHVLHECDNRKCVRPAHLWLGTHQENMEDRNQKGRNATGDRNGSRTHPESRPRGNEHYFRIHPEIVQGENNGNAKLSEADVLEIRRLYALGGISQAKLGKMFNVSQVMIGYIVRRENWTNI